jgi:sugar phosphate isomerase/epimerase
MQRRKFLQAGTATLFGSALVSRLLAAESEKKLFSAMGMSAPMSRGKFLKDAGVDFLTESVGSLLVPDQSEAEFEKNLATLATTPLPVLACGGFIRPKELRCVGMEANHDDVLKWADTTFRRMKRVGGKIIVFGSAGARELRDGWPREKADEQWVALLKRMGPLAEAQGITVTVEALQASECNFINHIAENAKLIRAAGHPNVRVLADFYHMTVMGDTPDDLKAAMDVVYHCEIAEIEGRTLLGVHGQDFRPYFKVLREGGYHGAISMEGKWTDEQVAPAFKELAKQAAEV